MFLHDNEIVKLLTTYGEPTLIKRIAWKIPKSYKIFLLKSVGHVTYTISMKQKTESGTGLEVLLCLNFKIPCDYYKPKRFNLPLKQ